MMRKTSSGSTPRKVVPVLGKSTLLAIWVATLEAAFAAYLVDDARFMAAYTVAFAFGITLGIGALFFVILHHLVGARWSVLAAKRMARIAQVLHFGPILFVPIVISNKAGTPWHHSSGEIARGLLANDHHFELPLFCLRATVYLGVWGVLAAFYRTGSKARTWDEQQVRTARLRRFAGPSMLGFGLATVFASFDWWMRLTPHFHSAVFGVYIFAGAVVSSLALLTLVTTWLTPFDLRLSSVATNERHDISKLVFGFVVFWAYIAYSQFLLIDYANLPNEVAFYALRSKAPWKTLTAALITCHFAIPFVLLLPQRMKQSPRVVVTVSALLLVAHYLDITWVILPALRPSGTLAWGFEEFAATCFVVFSGVCAFYGSGKAEPADLPVLPRPPESDLVYSATVGVAGARAVEVVPIRVVDTRADNALVSNSGFAIFTRLVPIAALCATIGGVFVASQFEAKVRSAATRANANSGKAALTSAQRDEFVRRGEYRWLSQKDGTLRIPIERARALYLAETHPVEVTPTQTNAGQATP